MFSEAEVLNRFLQPSFLCLLYQGSLPFRPDWVVILGSHDRYQEAAEDCHDLRL